MNMPLYTVYIVHISALTFLSQRKTNQLINYNKNQQLSQALYEMLTRCLIKVCYLWWIKSLPRLILYRQS